MLKKVVYYCLFLASVCSGPSCVEKRKTEINTVQGDRMLREEEARQALIIMVQQSDNEVLKKASPYLKTDKITFVENGIIKIGNWQCNLKERSFVLTLVSEPHLQEFSGVFEESTDQKWVARVTEHKIN